MTIDFPWRRLLAGAALCTAVACTPAGKGPDKKRDPVVKAVPLSAAGTDAFHAAAFDSKGRLYAAGVVADSTDANADRAMVVARFLADGTLDASFGDGGIVRQNVVEAGGGESARAVVVQSTGKIVIAGTVEADAQATGPAAADRDIALMRFNENGALDTTFGTGGILTLDLNQGIEVDGQNGPTWAGADAFWSLALAAGDKLVLHGATRGFGFQDDGTTPRTDTDFALVRLNADGTRDTSFGTDGVFTLDIEESNASPRGIAVLADGSIVAGGYARTASIGTTQPVAYKVTNAGVLDASFADGGVFHREVLAALAEIYALVPSGDGFVTQGYGRNSEAESVDWLSMRLTASGELDPAWGTGGALRVDVAGHNDNGRSLIALPDGRLMLFGSGTPSEGDADAMALVLKASGEPDEAFGSDGQALFELGGVADAFWGGAVSPDGKLAVLVGAKGAGTQNLGADKNDDAALVLIPLAD